MTPSEPALPLQTSTEPRLVTAKAKPAIPILSPEGIAAVLWTIAADVLLFRTGTYVGIAVFLLCVPAILRIATTRSASPTALSICGALAIAIALRLVWLGTTLTVISAVFVIVAMAMAARGRMPMVLEGAAWLSRCVLDGAQRLTRYRWTTRTIDRVRRHHQMAAVGLPILAATVFGTLFVLANPDWVDWSWRWTSKAWINISDWISAYSVWELPFCLLAAMAGVGLMRPRQPRLLFGGRSNLVPVQANVASGLYAAYRNTIATLIVLFSVYLGCEFWTLWARDFPPNFYYAGYAHQGAAWLTVALILATVSLSVIFGRSLRSDPRLTFIRKIAWVWSGLNFLLVLAVYHRLSLYVGYNGLTQMRIVGYFGVTLVAVGFALVIVKIVHDKSFWWLIRSQLISFVIAVMIFSITPVDYIAHRYNTTRVQSGDLAPSVMLAVKEINDEGLLPMLALIDHPNEIIRMGVRARLEQRAEAIASKPLGNWTQYQGSSTLLRSRLSSPSTMQQGERQAAMAAFRQFAMQWY